MAVLLVVLLVMMLFHFQIIAITPNNSAPACYFFKEHLWFEVDLNKTLHQGQNIHMQQSFVSEVNFTNVPYCEIEDNPVFYRLVCNLFHIWDFDIHVYYNLRVINTDNNSTVWWTTKFMADKHIFDCDGTGNHTLDDIGFEGASANSLIIRYKISDFDDKYNYLTSVKSKLYKNGVELQKKDSDVMKTKCKNYCTFSYTNLEPCTMYNVTLVGEFIDWSRYGLERSYHLLNKTACLSVQENSPLSAVQVLAIVFATLVLCFAVLGMFICIKQKLTLTKYSNTSRLIIPRIKHRTSIANNEQQNDNETITFIEPKLPHVYEEITENELSDIESENNVNNANLNDVIDQNDVTDASDDGGGFTDFIMKYEIKSRPLDVEGHEVCDEVRTQLEKLTITSNDISMDDEFDADNAILPRAKINANTLSEQHESEAENYVSGDTNHYHVDNEFDADNAISPRTNIHANTLSEQHESEAENYESGDTNHYHVDNEFGADNAISPRINIHANTLSEQHESEAENYVSTDHYSVETSNT